MTEADQILRQLVMAKREKEQHGETELYSRLKAGLWQRAKDYVDRVPEPNYPPPTEHQS